METWNIRMIFLMVGSLFLALLLTERSAYATQGSVKSIQQEFEAVIKIRNINLQISRSAPLTGALSAPTNYDCTVRRVPYAVRRRLRLSTFYSQYAHAYGIPVLGSYRVKRKALERACYVMRFLFADRKDIRDWFYRRNGRAGIMAQTEGTTSIPEHSFLPAWWNQRARGLGATIQVPISTGGEENLLCLSGDRYYNEDIFLHEFVHGIHNLGATGAIRGFDYRLRVAYNSARSRGLWRSTYALSTDREYFSEGTQSFFNVNAYSARPNGVHNHVNTRAKLRTYDPTLYNLVKEVFPCANNFLKRCDAKNGKRAPTFRMNCKNGGGTIVTDKPPTLPPKPNTPPTPPKPNTPPTPPNPNTPPTPPNPNTPPTPPNPNTPPTPPNPNTPPTPPNPNTPPTPPNPNTPPTPPNPNTPPTPPNPNTPPTPPNPNTPPTPPNPNTPTPPNPNTPPTPPNPNTPPTPPNPNTTTPPNPNTPPTPPNPNTPPTPPNPNTPPTPPNPNTPPTPPNPNTPPTPPNPNTPPPNTPPTPPNPNTPPVPTPPVPTPPKPTPPKPTRPPTNCKNYNRFCGSWASKGECSRNPGYMKTYCCKSCSGKSNCSDRNRGCASWAKTGECSRNPRYMLVHCKRSCNRC